MVLVAVPAVVLQVVLLMALLTRTRPGLEVRAAMGMNEKSIYLKLFTSLLQLRVPLLT